MDSHCQTELAYEPAHLADLANRLEVPLRLYVFDRLEWEILRHPVLESFVCRPYNYNLAKHLISG